MAWHDRRSGAINTDDFYAQRVNSNGVVMWSVDGVLVCTAGAYQQYAAIAPDQAGGAIIVWSVQSNIFAQRIDATGTPLWGTNGKQVAPGWGNQFSPCVQSLGDGSVVVAWVDGRPNWPGIYAQRITSAGAMLWNWPSGLLVCRRVTGAQGYPVITAGNAVTVVWEDSRNGDYDLYAQRITSVGSIVWDPNGVPVCTGAGDQRAPQLASDYTGGVIATWSERRGTGTFVPADIFVQRVDQNGSALWGAQGMTLCNAADDQDTPRIVSDPTGAIIVWHDNRVFHDIYAQRVNLSGATQWASNGIAVSAAPGYQVSPVTVSDMAGGAIVAWTENHGPSSDIYVNKIDSNGNTWASGDVALCSANLNQYTAAIGSDGHGGAIVGWEHETNGQLDIYAGRVASDGSVPTSVGNTPSFSGLVVRDQYPNPFTTSTTLDVFLPASSEVTIDVYDVAGRRMRHQSFGPMETGWQQVVLDANADSGRQLPSGVYFYKVCAAGEIVTKKMVIAR